MSTSSPINSVDGIDTIHLYTVSKAVCSPSPGLSHMVYVDFVKIFDVSRHIYRLSKSCRLGISIVDIVHIGFLFLLFDIVSIFFFRWVSYRLKILFCRHYCCIDFFLFYRHPIGVFVFTPSNCNLFSNFNGRQKKRVPKKMPESPPFLEFW